jgi:dTDP-4-amino-4,6-dideoxygalactose transaminase
MTRLEAQAKLRSENAAYLTKQFNGIEGIIPAKLYEGTTNSAYHLYMFRYDKSGFSDMSRERFFEALRAEGIGCSSGYGQMNSSEYVKGLAENKHYLKIYGKKKMKEWLDRNVCPQNDQLTKNEAVWFTQDTLLGSKKDMDFIVETVSKIQKNSSNLKK